MRRPNVDALGRSLTAKQWRGWEAYFEIRGPLGELRADYRAATIRKTLADLHRPEGHEGYATETFLLKFEPAQTEEEYILEGQKRKMTRDQANEAVVRLLCATYNAQQKDIQT